MFSPFDISRSRDTSNQQRRNPFLFTADRNFRGHSALNRVRHLDQCRDLAACERLAVEFQGVGRGAESDIGAVEGLEGERFG